MFAKTKNLLKKIHADESGAMAVEKVLLLALVAIPIIIVLFLFRKKIVEYFNKQSADLEIDG